MALSAVGLKTHIWNNNLKSLLFFIFYPPIITLTYAGVVFIGVAASREYPGGWEELLLRWQALFLEWWYAPYIGMLLFLSCTYLYHRNRIDMDAGTQPVTRENNREYYELLERLCISRGLTMPLFLIQQNDAPNAYTAGLSPHSYKIVVTSGLIQQLELDELEAVLAHELTHLINGDTRMIFFISMVTGIFAGISGMLGLVLRNSGRGSSGRGKGKAVLIVLGLWLVFQLGSFATLLTQMLISRRREYIADAGAVELTKNPSALMSALKKIGGQGAKADITPMKHLLFDHQGGLLSTHPKTADRIKAIAYYTNTENDIKRPWSKSVVRKARSTQAEVVW